MKYFYFFHFLILLTWCNAAAQGENNHWHFGKNHHIDFNVTPPVYAANSNLSTSESCASVSDAQGNLLFYTIGCRIWDRNGNEMPNATGLLGNGPIGPGGFGLGSSFDGVQVLPHPGNPDQYYVFSGSALETATTSIYYHLVDMSLNNGLGDVVNTQKNIVLLANGCTEYTITASGGCRSVWFIAMTSPGKYNAYKIDENGIHLTPVVSTPTVPAVTSIYYTKITNSGIAYTNTNAGVLRSQFNGNTGMFSNYELMSGVFSQSFELSPDNQKLYGGGPNQLTQWDLSLYPNIPAIAASAVSLAPASPSLYVFTNLRLGPDGKIYLMRLLTLTSSVEFHVDRIDQPNVAGAGAGYNSLVFNMPQNGNSLSLGARFISVRPFDTLINKVALDTVLCKEGPVTLASPHPGMSYLWNDGSQGQSVSVEQGGTYYVYTYTPDCKLYVDSFKVSYAPLSLDLGSDTILCSGTTYTLDATLPGATSYLWQDGSTSPQLAADKSGKYFVTVRNGHCFASDTLNIEVKVPAVNILQADTFICEQDQLSLNAKGNFDSRYSWNTGATGNSITIDQPGIYVVTAQNRCGTQTDSVRVEQVNCDCVPTAPSAFSPNGDGKNDVFLPLLKSSCITKSYELLIYNRYGQIVFSTNQNGVGWDGTYINGRTAELGVYYYILKLQSSYGNTAPLISKGQLTLVR